MSSDSKSQTIQLLCGCAIAAVCADWLTVRLIPVDSALHFALLARAFTASTTDTAIWSAEAIIFAILATVLAARLGSTARVVVTVQLVILSFLVQFGLWSLLHVPMRIVTLLLAIGAGFLSGSYVKTLGRGQQQLQAHYHQLELKNKELLEARVQLVKQDEVERRILAGDLHDQVLNDLKALRQKLQTDEKDAEADGLLTKAMTQIREVMDSLSPADLEHLGLIDAIEACIDKGAARAGYKVRFRSALADDDVQPLSSIQQALLYRLVQESVNNICKHANAQTVYCEITRDGDTAVVSIKDDGKGMDASIFRSDSRGLRYMRQRADLLGGTIGWRKGDGDKGTIVEITVPLNGNA